eukprot:1136707-Pelagomonas_calceolata.AAC.2
MLLDTMPLISELLQISGQLGKVLAWAQPAPLFAAQPALLIAALPFGSSHVYTASSAVAVLCCLLLKYGLGFGAALCMQRLAQSLYYLLLKCCLNQQRSVWEEVLSHEHNAMAPWRTGRSTRSPVLMAEAEQ